LFLIEIDPSEVSEVTAKFTVAVQGITSVWNERVPVVGIALGTIQVQMSDFVI
jgi:hypothetical protein